MHFKKDVIKHFFEINFYYWSWNVDTIYLLYYDPVCGAVDANNDLFNYLNYNKNPKSLANIIFTRTRIM